MNYSGLTKLANAIVMQAVQDYRQAATNIKKAKSEKIIMLAKKDISECEMFFKSDFFKVFTRVDGEYLLEQLRKEDGSGIKKRKRNEKNVSKEL